MTTVTEIRKHTHQVVFGRRVVGCPRCAQLVNGAAPVQGWGSRRREAEAQAVRDVHAHFASDRHRNGGCGPVCTYGEW